MGRSKYLVAANSFSARQCELRECLVPMKSALSKRNTRGELAPSVLLWKTPVFANIAPLPSCFSFSLGVSIVYGSRPIFSACFVRMPVFRAERDRFLLLMKFFGNDRRRRRRFWV